MTQGNYNDIIHLPHHQSRTRPHMTLHDRAAQFSPFAALTGYEDAVKETARLTNRKLELSEEMKSELSAKLTLLQEKIKEYPEVAITYFVADNKKSGGSYVTETGTVKRIDDVTGEVIMNSRKVILIDDIAEIMGAIFCPSS